MGFEELKGQSRAVGLLQNSIHTSRIAHAYIFYGPDGVGKNKAALLFAQSINCLASEGNLPCGKCLACRKISAKNHPDSIRIEPEGNAIKISQMRSMQEKAYLRCYEAKYKVIIIDGAERMTLAAANSLLHILEEPPDRTVLVLIAADTGQLPLTILSRCQPIPFMPLGEDVLKEILHKKAVQAIFPLGLANGSAAKALEMNDTEGISGINDEVQKLLADLQEGRYAPLLAKAEELGKNKEHTELILDMLSAYYRDKLVNCHGVQNNLLDTLTDKDYRIEECCNALEQLRLAARQIQRNANVRLVLEVLLLKLKDIEKV